jgi:hypothetical protein
MAGTPGLRDCRGGAAAKPLRYQIFIFPACRTIEATEIRWGEHPIPSLRLPGLPSHDEHNSEGKSLNRNSSTIPRTKPETLKPHQ